MQDKIITYKDSLGQTIACFKISDTEDIETISKYLHQLFENEGTIDCQIITSN